MKITRTAQKINLNNIVDISVDVHKDTLCFFFEIDGKEFSDTCSNRTTVIEKRLLSYHDIAGEHGRKGLRVICEPTGQFQNKLMRTARRLGFLTNYVNAESVAKFRVVESNDSNKTDKKDPRVIGTLGKLNKVIRFRMIGEEYLMLRKLHKIYDECDVAITSIRCRISKLLVELFCDYSFEKDFLYSNSGLALVEQYGCNPYRIVEDGYDLFCKKMRKAAPRILSRTLERLWADAGSSVLNEMPEGYVRVLEEYLYDRLDDYFNVLERKERITDQMLAILEKLRQDDPLIPPPTPHVISAKNLARLLAETGPLSDFEHWRKLMRYAGLNLKTRQSGTFQGQNKISKKGRKLLRKVLHAIALPLVRKGCLYGAVYHQKKDETKMPGNKAMTIVARQLLRKLYGWYRSGEAFDEQRFFTCKSRYQKLAEAA
ncbi:MAG: transposase [Deltaproteobacteria bacterium]